MRILVAAIALASVAAGCAPTTPSPSGSGSVPVETRLIYGCGGDERLTLDALSGPLGAELGSDMVAEALRALIQTSPPESELPESGWRRVLDTEDAVIFMAVGDGDPRWHLVAFARDGADAWTIDRVGACDLRVVMTDPDAVVADWWVDPARPVDPAATSVDVVVLERACSGGQDPTGRILPPTIIPAADTVTVVIAVRQDPAGGDCIGNPPTPYTLVLPEPLGGRQLFDGGTLPPRQPVPVG
jgi:hypothetical protein